MQITPYNLRKIGFNSAYLREAQLKVSSTLPNIAMASLIDIGEEFNIHPVNKKVGSQRLAFLALEKLTV